MTTTFTRLGFACWAAACALAVPAFAQTEAPKPSPTEVDFFTPVDAATLATQRGGAQLVRNDMTLAGTTADNSATNVSTGSNTITSGAFANMTGFPVVIQNSGANVLIQSAVILHLQMN